MFLIFQLTPPYLGKGQDGKLRFHTYHLFFFSLELVCLDQFYWGQSFEQTRNITWNNSYHKTIRK